MILTDDKEVIMSYKVYAECGKTNVLFPRVHPNEANIELVSSEVIEFKDDGNPFVLQFYALPTFSFMHDISFLSDKLEEVETHDNYSFLSSSPLSLNLFTLQAVFPRRGRWAVKLYAGKADTNNLHLAIEVKPVNVTKPQCDFILKEHLGYPEICHTVASKSNFRLLSCNEQDKIAHTCRCEGGELKLTFTAHPDAKIEHYIKSGKSGQSDALRCFTKTTQDTNNPSFYMFRAVFPSPGWWRVILTDDKEVIMSYKVYAECGKTNVLFPRIRPNEANIELVSSEVIEFKDDGNPFVLQFYALPTFSFMHDISLLSDKLEKVETYDNYSFLSSSLLSPNLFTLQAVFPCRGRWAVKLYAGKADANTLHLAMEVKPVNVTKPQSDLCFFFFFFCFVFLWKQVYATAKVTRR